MSDSWDPPDSAERKTAADAETLDGFSGWRQIGRGGDAIVYRAVQDASGSEVAIKVLTVEDAESVRRFTREVQMMVALGRQHPNIANVLQIGTSSRGRPCIVMDYYELGSLDKRLSHGPLSADEVLRVGIVIADALAFAHSRGVLHRDVKPQNILILPESYVLADFGIARLIDSAPSGGSDRFSYRHASPQVLDGYPPSESDDIFSLGATMFHLLDGKPPFTTPGGEPDSALSYIKRVRIAEPRPLPPDVPPGLADAILQCLRKEPAERFASAEELRDRLVALRASVSGPAPRKAAVRPAPAPNPEAATPGLGRPAAPRRQADPRSRFLPMMVIALGGVLVGAVLVWALFRAMPVGPIPPDGSSPGSVATGAASPDERHNPNLAPRGLRVVVRGTTATATWDRSVDEAEAYGWGVTSSPDQTPRIENRNLPGERTAQVEIDPAWSEVCFTVVGIRGAQLGGDRACVPTR